VQCACRGDARRTGSDNRHVAIHVTLRTRFARVQRCTEIRIAATRDPAKVRQ